ncbi:hypothetical protein GCM10018952_23650 [Streptosporangium vulgare]
MRARRPGRLPAGARRPASARGAVRAGARRLTVAPAGGGRPAAWAAFRVGARQPIAASVGDGRPATWGVSGRPSALREDLWRRPAIPRSRTPLSGTIHEPPYWHHC